MHKEVILLLSNGKSWPVICYQYSTDGPKLNVRFGNGWRKFSLDNNLEVGDACVFELVEGAEASMNITIYKKQADQDANFGSSMDDKSKEQQVEFHERLVIKTEEICLDDILMSKTNSPGKA
ncbi:putative B3 domain-containing protein Os03g0621600 [Hibiscus syriacus]|uniref:putative B3 domain-containing protein Os03g0621600 n=1 Tax=Hibiscus syriacus TaxID=106335 RepID=UPI001922A6BA|nr:putative B3 domain-containing protein Os03g0621600 [Hibiscus syriacus]